MNKNKVQMTLDHIKLFVIDTFRIGNFKEALEPIAKFNGLHSYFLS